MPLLEELDIMKAARRISWVVAYSRTVTLVLGVYICDTVIELVQILAGAS